MIADIKNLTAYTNEDKDIVYIPCKVDIPNMECTVQSYRKDGGIDFEVIGMDKFQEFEDISKFFSDIDLEDLDDHDVEVYFESLDCDWDDLDKDC